MDLSGRRKSDNVEDRRGVSGGTVAGIGIGGVIVAVLFSLLTGNGDLTSTIGNVLQNMPTQQTEQQGEFTPTEQEKEYEDFAKTILAGTEDAWTQIFKEQGFGEYPAPTLVFFKGAVQSACGNATSSVGPFYCSGDQKLYIDLDFFEQMDKQMSAGGELAHAYVIAHEVGHHIEYCTGLLTKVHQAMQQNPKQQNQLSVRLELLADYYAGVWANRDSKTYNSIDTKDIDEAINCAKKIGDDYLQKQAYGQSSPESFTHGTSEQRARWFKKGLQSGTFAEMPTFEVDYSQL